MHVGGISTPDRQAVVDSRAVGPEPVDEVRREDVVAERRDGGGEEEGQGGRAANPTRRERHVVYSIIWLILLLEDHEHNKPNPIALCLCLCLCSLLYYVCCPRLRPYRYMYMVVACRRQFAVLVSGVNCWYLARYIPRYQDTLRLSINRKSTSSKVFVEDSVPSSRRGKPSYCTAQATGWYANSLLQTLGTWDRNGHKQGKAGAGLVCVYTHVGRLVGEPMYSLCTIKATEQS